ncbi:hypothetical protein [Nostoc sp. DedQUE09]|nr:hypothetical protein [Nostoc sp. DedQUE09]MDZ7951371.1 hypothetical protein [Nostoc sp. DedQUE09]
MPKQCDRTDSSTTADRLIFEVFYKAIALTLPQLPIALFFRFSVK